MADRTEVEALPAPGMIQLRGALPALAAAAGLPLPPVRGIVAQGEERLGWMSPDELLLMLPRAAVAPRLAAVTAALGPAHHLALDVSDMRALFRLSGPHAREALARLVPADLHPDRFGPGELRRTRLAQIPCAFWLEPDGLRLLCFRSVAAYAGTILSGAAEAADRAGPVLFPPG